jgi:hypothetical protein
LSRYVGANLSSNVFIEHSLVIYDKPPKDEIESPCNVIGVMSEHRKRQIAKHTHKHIVSIGAYILYADSYCSRKPLSSEKIGRYFLVFPIHTTETCNVVYDTRHFLKEIELRSEGYSKVIVCLFYHDILKGLAKIFTDRGYEVVTAGHRYDPFFLSKLRKIIELCDASMSNGWGTHIGYCIALGKPHYVFKQKYEEFETHAASVTADLRAEIDSIVSVFNST